jgi:hypothetical protein
VGGGRPGAISTRGPRYRLMLVAGLAGTNSAPVAKFAIAHHSPMSA